MHFSTQKNHKKACHYNILVVLTVKLKIFTNKTHELSIMLIPAATCSCQNQYINNKKIPHFFKAGDSTMLFYNCCAYNPSVFNFSVTSSFSRVVRPPIILLIASLCFGKISSINFLPSSVIEA